MNRLLVKAITAGLGLLTIFYSASGMLTKSVDKAGLHTWGCDFRDWGHTNATPAGTILYTHDAGGNMTYGPGTNDTFLTCTFDARNRLLAVGDLRSTYDALGSRTSASNATGRTTFGGRCQTIA
jgi:hypothetical protein